MKFKDLEDGAEFVVGGLSGFFQKVNEADEYNAVMDSNSNYGIKFNQEDEVVLLSDLQPDPEDLIDGEAELRSLSGYNEGF